MSSLITRSGILVADDDEDQRALVAAILHEDGHRVVEARDGAHLLEVFQDGLLHPTAPSGRKPCAASWASS